MSPPRRWRPVAVAGAAALCLANLGGGRAFGVVRPPVAAGSVVAPTPPVSPADFSFDPKGKATDDSDRAIPDPATPLGPLPVRSRRCNRTFSASAGATSAEVDRAIASVENRIEARYVVCLVGTFTSPLHVDNKYAAGLLTIEPAPGRTATLALGVATAAEADQNEYTGTTGGVAVVDSRSVEIVGLHITGLHGTGTQVTPAGIYVTVRGALEGDGPGGHPSACFERGDHFCGDIYLLDDVVSDIANDADEVATSRAWCGNSEVDAFGIAVESFGTGAAEALRHVVVDGDVVDHTRTGQSETLTVNGDVADFVLDGDTVYDTDNIGIDDIGWESGTDQARDGVIEHDTVADVDTDNNDAYGAWSARRATCVAQPENAAGIYDDGGAWIWIADNVVDNTDQGIDLDVETPHRFTDDLLVTGNRVVDDRGTSLGLPSDGAANPPPIPGRATAAGHAYEAFYVDSYGAGSAIRDVYAADNTFENASQYYGATSAEAAPVVDVSGRWSRVVLFDNTIVGGGPGDRRNALLELDSRPRPATGTVIDCTRYEAASSVAANFYAPDGDGYVSLAAWRAHNGGGFDHDSSFGPTHCPAPPP